MSNSTIVITAAARTPMGKFLGQLKDVPAPQLGAAAISGVLQRSKIESSYIDEVIMGCVLPAGQGQAPARQAALLAGLPDSIGCTTINKMCGSGMKAVMLAHDLLLTGQYKAIIAGGMESMSNTPYLLKKARAGYRLGHDKIYDHMLLDGLEDAYTPGKHMGCFAEECAQRYNISRKQQDEFAAESLKRTQNAIQKRLFMPEIVPVTVKTEKQTNLIEQDECPDLSALAKIPKLLPAFQVDGTITAANASSITDGAAVLLVMTEQLAEQLHIKPLAKIAAHSTFAQEPAWFTTAPIEAIKRVLNKANWNISDVDLFEINEAFAVVTLAAMQELAISAAKVNVHGGACALGHPIGATGARILTTLIYALQQRHLKRGVAALCIGGGEATAVAIELTEY